MIITLVPVYTTTYANVGIVEDISDIDQMFSVQAPYDAVLPNKNWVVTAKWHKYI
ncbi:hypothetical protein GWP85_07385 [Acinetobacter beijerinckii]|uniref:hypothetical protein n=1 Tax=Acinetobacter beijerinckii TaxID=262668 RepID=UPI0023DDFAF0|nr:hypothetical protein [Acinetobacter beijerinckii]MDF2417337.1 hypothetical protein [Acinetobacter beijerinckii]